MLTVLTRNKLFLPFYCFMIGVKLRIDNKKNPFRRKNIIGGKRMIEKYIFMFRKTL
jgi:hypothetical protein